MKGRLYTADEIFKAIHEGTVRAAKHYNELFDDEETARTIAHIGGGIAYETANILGFDMDQLTDYCLDKLEEEDDDSED